MQEFTQAIHSNQEISINIDTLENIAYEFPYFQFAKTILLKKYHKQENNKYNDFLKKVAIHTQNREVLFDYITHFNEKEVVLKKNQENSCYKNNNLDFKSSDKLSFNQWLQLSDTTPISRSNKEVKETANSKLNIINKFIQNNPKISPVKKGVQSNKHTLTTTEANISNELMTETLAKVYLTQKKYNNAIQAYKILSLKYPEKSGLFADQIQQIKILQNT